MSATRNLKVTLGDDYTHVVTLEDSSQSPWNLTGYSGLSHVRIDPEVVAAPEASFTVTITDAVNGVLEMTMDNTVTSTLNPKKKYFYDLQLTDGSGDLTTILKGELEVEQDVTH